MVHNKLSNIYCLIELKEILLSLFKHVLTANQFLFDFTEQTYRVWLLNKSVLLARRQKKAQVSAQDLVSTFISFFESVTAQQVKMRGPPHSRVVPGDSHRRYELPTPKLALLCQWKYSCQPRFTSLNV